VIADAGIQPSTGRRQTISPIAGTNRTVTGASGCAPGSGKIASLQCCEPRTWRSCLRTLVQGERSIPGLLLHCCLVGKCR
jgi:hypothetical protein